MKYLKATVVIALFASIFASASEEKKPRITISYTEKKPSDSERYRDIMRGSVLASISIASLMELDAMAFFNKMKAARWYRAPLYTAARIPLYATSFYGAYLMGKGALAKYYTSNWEWSIRTKNYEISRRSKRSTLYPEGNRETISFPEQK